MIRRVGALLFAVLFLLSSQIAAQTKSQPSSPRSPAFVFLRMKVRDAVNIEITEDRIRRVLQMVDGVNKEFPAANVKVTVFVNGAVSEVLAERNSQTGIVDLLRDAAKKGSIEMGYDGWDEPRSKEEPLYDYRDQGTPKENYLARVAVAERILTEGRDPVTGKPMPQADGGLKRMQQVFGEASCIWGTHVFSKDPAVGTMPDWGSDTEVVQQIRLLNTRATMPGVLDDVPHMDFFYDDWVTPFSLNLSPAADSSRDLYWQENRLRISERSDKPSRVIATSVGTDALKDYFEKLDRSKIRVVQIEISDEHDYLQGRYRQYLDFPPTKYAAKHPDTPKLPKEAFAPEADVNAAFQKEQDALKFVLQELVSANAGVWIVGNKDLLAMTPASFGFRLSTASLRKAIAEADRSWGDALVPPKYVKVDERYLSLSETFQVLADALVERHRTGKLPESVEVLNVSGPVNMPSGTGLPKGEVSAAAVALAAVYIVPALHEGNWSPIPRNVVPGEVQVADLKVNGAQYLHLLMKAFLLDDLEVKLPITPTGMVWAREAIAFRTRPPAEMGTIWTIKPAPIDISKLTATRR